MHLVHINLSKGSYVFIFIVVQDLEYMLKISAYQNMSSCFKNSLTITVRSLTSSLCAFYLHCFILIVTSFIFVYEVFFFVANKTYMYCSSNDM